MKTYRDMRGDSGISAYACGEDWIKIEFRQSGIYEYRASEIGPAHIRAMKRLAETGDGLNTYINRHPEVRNGWSSKR